MGVEGKPSKIERIGKLERIRKIEQLGAGPQVWFFLDRKIFGDLKEYDLKMKENPQKIFGIYANEEKNRSITEIFKDDLQRLIRSNLPQIRILFGDNGTGKSTHLQYFKKILEDHYQNLYLFIEIDLRHIAEKTEEGLWLEIFHQIYDSIHKREDIVKLLREHDERDLLKIFKHTNIAKNVKTFGQDTSETFFYGDEFQRISNIQRFFNGIIDILMERKILTVITIDEVQHIENWGEPIFQAFLESFISSTYDRYMNPSNEARLYLILSFLLKTPDSREDKYKFLEKHSPGFVSRMKGKEIILCNFSEKEHQDALKLCAEITNLALEEQKKFAAEIKSSMTYWVFRTNPREFGKYIKDVYKRLGFLTLTPSERCQIYEKESRDQITHILYQKGFSYVATGPECVQGYNFDVYAEDRGRDIPKKYAFGEIKTTQRKSLKSEVEKFSNWIKDLKNTSKYNKSGNFYFLISPYDPTSAVQEILTHYAIEWFKFELPELVFEEESIYEEKAEKIPELVEVKPKEIQDFFIEKPVASPKIITAPKKEKKPKLLKKKVIISETTSLKEIKIAGLGPARLKTLEEHGIKTIKQLIDAKNIKGITTRFLLSWRQEYQRLLNP